MEILIDLAILLVSVLFVFLVAHGYANTVDYIGIVLRHHAKSVRAMHARRAALLNQRWRLELED